MNEYTAGANFLLNYGLFISIFIICIVLVLALSSTWLWVKCLQDVWNRNEVEFKDRNLWITLLLVPAFGIFFWGAGFIFMFIVSLIYIFMYRPKIF